MIKKQNLWFLTLFSLILVLGVYYITMPDEILINKETDNETVQDVNMEIVENEYLTALRVEKEDERETLRVSLEKILNNTNSTSEEKNNAYLQIKALNELGGQEEQLEKTIKQKYSLDSFIKIDDKDISVVVIKKEHDINLANNIMRTIQDCYDDKMSITVKFSE